MPFLQLRIAGIAEARQRLGRWNAMTFANRAAQVMGPIVQMALRQFVPVRTGATRGSIDTMFSGRVLSASGSAVAAYLEWGTRPHLIVAHGKALRFVGRDGQVVFRHEVRHPGTRPTHFVEEAAAYMRPPIQTMGRAVILEMMGTP